ncbi:MAG: hypothetical protein IJ411_04635 [Oscillospiraceae bacterium]|nr:hypothetical protein [Oscillospiraceae bacterium]
MTPSLLLLALSNMLFFALHIGTVGSFPKPLSKEEELDCFIRMKEGDTSAKNKLIEHNLRLVAHIIKKNGSKRTPFPDRLFLDRMSTISGKYPEQSFSLYLLFSR